MLPAQPIPDAILKPSYAFSRDGSPDDLRVPEEPGEVQTPEAIVKIKAAAEVAANALKLALGAAQEGGPLPLRKIQVLTCPRNCRAFLSSLRKVMTKPVGSSSSWVSLFCGLLMKLPAVS